MAPVVLSLAEAVPAAPATVEDQSPRQSPHSQSPVSEEGETRDADLSEDEGTAPEKPAFSGLF